MLGVLPALAERDHMGAAEGIRRFGRARSAPSSRSESPAAPPAAML